MIKDPFECPSCEELKDRPFWSGLSCGCGAWVPFWCDYSTQETDPEDPVSRAYFYESWSSQVKDYLDD